MAETLLNNELSATCPAGFELIEPAEAGRMLGIPPERLWTLRDPERHIIIVIQWYDSGHKLLAKAFRAKDQIKRIDKVKRKAGKGSGYASEEPYELTVANAEAWGLDSVYTAGGIDHVNTTIVFKSGSCFYTIALFARAATAAESRQVFGELVESLRLA